MTAKRYFVAVWSALALIPAGLNLSAAPLIFFFSGQITERRAQNSVFTEPDTDQFYGYFSYDTSATAVGGAYPLLSFSVDGNPLDSTNNSWLPQLPGIIVRNDGVTGIGDSMEIVGFYPPATANYKDDGSIAIQFTDSSGLVFTNSSLPTSLSLSSFDKAVLFGGNSLFPPPPQNVSDAGIITQLIQVPEPAAWGTLSLGLAVCYRKWHTRNRAIRADP